VKQSRIPWIVILAATLMGGCFGKKNPTPVAGTSAEPDKVLYDRAVLDSKKSHYAVARLGLQTLINTYPDSEYLAKAKLAIADSYSKEGGTAGLKQSIIEYKDFITFFPFLDEAAYAQFQIGMAHYRQMDKPDRDHSEAVETEAELQTFLDKYPNSPLYPEAQQRLRETQEVLAQGNFLIARFYVLRGANKAAGARLLELTARYPLFSQADEANLMLAQIYEKGERNDFASQYYSRIVREYPLSPLVPVAKQRLNKLGAPVPQPDPAAVARMQKDQEAQRLRAGALRRSLGMIKRAPDVTMAAHAGEPTLTPASESGDETLAVGPAPVVGPGGGSALGATTATVETVTPGTAAPEAATAGSATSETVVPVAATSSTPASDPPTATVAATTDAPATPSAGTAADSSAQTPAAKAAPADKSKESTSKKKKGIHKILPF
jgi:outer membrane protein assembly factor BamD